MYKFNDISVFNRHIQNIMDKLREEITSKDVQTSLDCKTRNAVFQKKLTGCVDKIINNCYEQNDDKRLFSKTEILNKLKEQNDVCVDCKKSKEKYEGDHIVPWSKGGKTNYENLQVLCKHCHAKKSSIQLHQANLGPASPFS
jgi:5-methylcytosine-specific restriction endonuclease McrA